MFVALTQWYTENARPLPWRETGTSPWAIMVCEIMSQQTPVSRVIPAWEEWLERWPSPADMARATPAEVLVAWGRLGYPRRALRLHECARTLVERHDGSVPRTRDELLALPGIGEYTADAILAFAYQRRSVVLDTNIRRVIARLNGHAHPSASATRTERERATLLVPENDHDAALWNAAIMELGALVCISQNPRCEACPLREHCQWLHAGKPNNAPRKKKQGYHGTHRQARGAIMAVLREHNSEVSYRELLESAGLTPSRFEKALASLVDDKLAERNSRGYRLPR